jgi:hypothetical protein
VPGVLVGLVEVEHVDDPELAALHRVLQSTTQATGHAVPQAWQVRAISVMPSPVSTSASVMSSDPQSGQVGVEDDPELVHRGSPLPGV